MSSGNLVIPADTAPFFWSEEESSADYLTATYEVSSVCSPEEAAIGMAMEQSASTLTINGYVDSSMLEGWTIRILSVREQEKAPQGDAVPAYFLATEVYLEHAGQSEEFHSEITLAIPLCLLHGKPSQFLNVVIGELPRLGFLTRFRLKDMKLPTGFGPGPSFGREGILHACGVESGPILCRAMRPGVGLDLETMATLNRDVLSAGFHLIKDDELICFQDNFLFMEHVKAMVQARDEARQATGERKLYIANLFCEAHELTERWHIALQAGADGVLVAPFIQGPGIVSWLAQQREIPVLAHNSFTDILTRNRNWGIDDAVLSHLMRHLGADWFVTPGHFATHRDRTEETRRLMDTAIGFHPGMKSMMPNVQGGKHPGDLSLYERAVGDKDFMLIVANWVDSHDAGLKAAAAEFREAVDAFREGV